MNDVVLSPKSLSSDDAEALAGHVADLSAAGLPLAPGLRAAAEECRGRLARALRRAADLLDQGKTLEQTLSSPELRLPEHVRGLIAAAARTGNMGQALGEMLAQRRQSRELRRKVRSALAYPAIVTALALAMLVGFQLFAFRPLLKLFEEFELQVPLLVRQAIWWSNQGSLVILALGVALPVILIVARLALGAVRWRRLLATAPLVGPLWHWTGIAEMTRLLALLLEQQTPMAEALRLAGAGTSEANVRQACLEMAEGAQGGKPLADLVQDCRRLPASLVPLVAWGERTGELPTALRSASEHFASRVQVRAVLLRTVLPPFTFLTIGAVVLAFVNTVVTPMVTFIDALSW